MDPEGSAVETRRIAILGAAAPLAFVFAVIATASLRQDYSHYSSFISELGEAGGP